MGKRPKQCEYCGRTFTPSKSIHKYCSDKCRKRAHRERQRAEREAEKKERQERAPQPRKIYDANISVTDPRCRLIEMRAYGLLTAEYWTLYAEVDKIYNNGAGVVNGVSVNDNNFAQEVLARIYTDGRIVSWTQSKTS